MFLCVCEILFSFVAVFFFLSEGLSKEHHREGRVIALEYASLTLLVLYVPNNGTTAESFRRRYHVGMVRYGMVGNGTVRLPYGTIREWYDIIWE